MSCKDGLIGNGVYDENKNIENNADHYTISIKIKVIYLKMIFKNMNTRFLKNS